MNVKLYQSLTNPAKISMNRVTGKTLNVLGQAYKNAKPHLQLKYKAALLEAGEIDKTNYWRAFRDVWQYTEKIGKAPFMIVVLADEILDYENQPTQSKA